MKLRNSGGAGIKISSSGGFEGDGDRVLPEEDEIDGSRADFGSEFIEWMGRFNAFFVFFV